MRRALIALSVFAVLVVVVTAQVGNFKTVIYAVDARTIAATGGVATLTLTPLGSYVAITCQDTDSCAITMGEGGIQDGMRVTVANMSTNYVTFAPSAGVFESPCPLQLQQYETVEMIYRSDRWVNAGPGLTCRWITVVTDTQIKALPTTPIECVPAPASGYRIKMLSGTLVKEFSAGAYTGVDTTYASLQLQTEPGGKWVHTPLHNDNTTTPAMTTLSTFLGANDRVVDLIAPYGSAQGTGTADPYVHAPILTAAPSGFDADPLDLFLDNNGSGDLGGGNAANTLTVIVYFAREIIP